jgi:tRNA A37 threonylcarbamoyladenosine synthetase subunit TsaC/SUA5/YrdC
VIASVGRPIYSTSVNVSGEAPLVDMGDICRAFGSLVALVVRAETPLTGPPSTVVDLSGGAPRVLRQGAVVVRGIA